MKPNILTFVQQLIEWRSFIIIKANDTTNPDNYLICSDFFFPWKNEIQELFNHQRYNSLQFNISRKSSKQLEKNKSIIECHCTYCFFIY